MPPSGPIETPPQTPEMWGCRTWTPLSITATLTPRPSHPANGTLRLTSGDRASHDCSSGDGDIEVMADRCHPRSAVSHGDYGAGDFRQSGPMSDHNQCAALHGCAETHCDLLLHLAIEC